MVQMLCMTTKQKFTVEDPTVITLQNGRYAYRCECPWKGKDGRTLHAFKFASTQAYQDYCERRKAEQEDRDESPEQDERPESPVA